MGISTGREVFGDADTALHWVRDADLPQLDRQNFNRFIKRFPSLSFARDTEASLAQVESGYGLVLPPHIQRSRLALSFTHSPLLALFDGFDYECGASDLEGDIWYSIGLGNAGDELLAELVEHAHGYVIGGSHGSEDSYLFVDTRHTEDERIFECDGYIFADAVADGDPVEEVIAPAFASYSSMLGHIVALRTWAGEVTTARQR